MELMCQILEVSRSGFYAWRQRVPGSRAQRRHELAERIAQVHRASHQRYGAPRVHRELAAQGIPCSKNTVAKLMSLRQLRSKMQRRFRVRTTDSRHTHPVAPNRLQQQFACATDQLVWLADITYIPTGEGWLYLAAVLDLGSRAIVGWATADSLRTALPLSALQMALDRAPPEPGLIHHSDRGVQYAGDVYQRLLHKHSLVASMSRRGNCYDNAPMESFFSTLKRELTRHVRYATRDEAELALFEYIEVFYNRQRRHSSLGYRTPAEAQRTLAAANREEGRGGVGERGLVSPTSENAGGAIRSANNPSDPIIST